MKLSSKILDTAVAVLIECEDTHFAFVSDKNRQWMMDEKVFNNDAEACEAINKLLASCVECEVSLTARDGRYKYGAENGFITDFVSQNYREYLVNQGFQQKLFED